jgi:hypothetical protein
MGGCLSTPADAGPAVWQHSTALARLPSGGSLIAPVRASDSLTRTASKLRADSAASREVSMPLDVISKVREGAQAPASGPTPRAPPSRLRSAARARRLHSSRARARPTPACPASPRRRPTTPAAQVQSLQQALTLLSGEPLLALPDAAEVIAQHLGVDVVG